MKYCNASATALIEVPSDAAKFEEQRKRIIQAVAARIKDSGILQSQVKTQST